MSEQRTDLKQFWAQVIATIKKGDINRSLWEAVEVATPIVIEEDTLVLGFAPVNMKYSGYLKTPGNAGVVRRAIESVAGKRLEVQMIEGDTLEAWERYKERMQAASGQTEQVARFAVGHKTTLEGWQQLGQEVRSMYYEMAGRERPLNHARFLVRVIPFIAKTEDRLRGEAPDAEELHDTELNRTFDRISSLCGIPGGLVALEYLRYADSRKKG
jgi:hypothetical protein